MRTQKKRRIENKTDYKLRLGLLKSGIPRIVIRKTNKYLTVQLVETKEAQDRVISGVSSKELLKNGWDEKFKGSLKSIPASYLTGMLFAKKVGKGEFVLDNGMIIHLKGNRVYALAKGMIDGGLKIRLDKSIFPPEGRINGEHLKPELRDIISKVKSKIGGEK